MSSEERGPQAPEAVIARLRPHVRALILPSFALIVIVLAASYFSGRFDEVWISIAILVLAAVLVLLLWVFPLLAWLGRNYTITTRRIVLRSGFLVRIRQELLHSRGYDVTVRKGALQSLFGSGDVEINSGLERPVVLKDVPDADLVQAALHDLMEQSLNSVAARRQQTQSSSDETTAWGRR
jgi:membrane protein YdbS with pleckstrin-like domain